WCWVAGTTWGPSWTACREGDGVFAWAPLPPLRRGETSINIDVVFGRIRPDYYVYTDERYITDPELTRHIRPGRENVTIINNTKNVTNYTVVNNRVVNRSLDVQKVEQVTGKKVQHLKVAESTKVEAAKVSGNEVAD